MLRAVVAAPFLLLLVLFALSNRQSTEFTLWPTDYAIEAPLSLAVLVAMGMAFVAGALIVWVSVLGARHRARRAEYQARLLEAQVAELTAKLAPPTAAQAGARPLLPASQ
jgi:lipopolysaccharide assembly protein A